MPERRAARPTRSTAAQQPASRALAAELKKKVRGRGIVVGLDTERQYTPLVSGLAAGDHGFG